MKKIFNYSVIVLLAVLGIAACKKDDDKKVTPDPEPTTGTVKLEFFNRVGSSNLNLGNQWYKNENGDSFTVSKFNYYISNIKLNGEGGAMFTETESYHLIQQADMSSMSFDLKEVPSGKYSSITFTIGVDSVRNVSGAQTGALDPANGMFWSWNSGYIMLKFEGNSPKSPEVGGQLMLHAGGFSGANSVLRTVTLSFPGEITVGSTDNHLHLEANVLALFKSPNKIDFSATNTIHMPGAAAKMLADNYANMFMVSDAGTH